MFSSIGYIFKKATIFAARINSREFLLVPVYKEKTDIWMKIK